MKKRELTLRVGDEAVHFNLNHNVKQPEFDNIDCNIQSSMNENEMNFKYLDVQFLNSNFESKEAVLSIDENSVEKSCSNEEIVEETEISSEGLALMELPSHLKYAFLEPEKARPVIISAALTELEEKKLLEILIK